MLWAFIDKLRNQKTETSQAHAPLVAAQQFQLRILGTDEWLVEATTSVWTSWVSEESRRFCSSPPASLPFVAVSRERVCFLTRFFLSFCMDFNQSKPPK